MSSILDPHGEGTKDLRKALPKIADGKIPPGRNIVLRISIPVPKLTYQSEADEAKQTQTRGLNVLDVTARIAEVQIAEAKCSMGQDSSTDAEPLLKKE